MRPRQEAGGPCPPDKLGSGLAGTLFITRTDAAPSLNWSVTVPVILVPAR
jgi:hypothetical protein